MENQFLEEFTLKVLINTEIPDTIVNLAYAVIDEPSDICFLRYIKNNDSKSHNLTEPNNITFNDYVMFPDKTDCLILIKTPEHKAENYDLKLNNKFFAVILTNDILKHGFLLVLYSPLLKIQPNKDEFAYFEQLAKQEKFPILLAGNFTYDSCDDKNRNWSSAFKLFPTKNSKGEANSHVLLLLQNQEISSGGSISTWVDDREYIVMILNNYDFFGETRKIDAFLFWMIEDTFRKIKLKYIGGFLKPRIKFFLMEIWKEINKKSEFKESFYQELAKQLFSNSFLQDDLIIKTIQEFVQDCHTLQSLLKLEENDPRFLNICQNISLQENFPPLSKKGMLNRSYTVYSDKVLEALKLIKKNGTF